MRRKWWVCLAVAACLVIALASPTITWAAGADRDGDGILDGLDNCPDLYNPEQGDRDLDLVGDLCDAYPDLSLRVRTDAPVRALIGEALVVTYRLENPEGVLLEELRGVVTTLSVDGSAIFGFTAHQGLIHAGWGSSRARVEFVDGLVSLEIRDDVAEFVDLGVLDTEAIGVGMDEDVFEDFERHDGMFEVDSEENMWEWGVPTSGPNRAFSGEKVWATVLDGNYPERARDSVMTPFFALSYSQDLQVGFRSWHESESFWDRGKLQITLDGGVSWRTLRFFSGPKFGYDHHVIDISQYSGHVVRFRFYFESSPFTTRSGWYIDDFSLKGVGTTIRFANTLNNLPVANAGGDQNVECDSVLSAAVTLDGSGSYDLDSSPGTNDDIVTWFWRDLDENILFGRAELVSREFPLGRHEVELEVVDREGESGRDRVWIEVEDTVAPSGSVTAPEPGRCFGSEQLPVVVAAEFEDSCDPGPFALFYTPDGGPRYSDHGDLEVTVTGEDRYGNRGSDNVFFTIDLVQPEVTIIEPPEQFVAWEEMPARLLFDATDDDGATGEPVHELVYLGNCLLFDGNLYGNQDGRLIDEILPLGDQALCEIAEQCGSVSWLDPVLSVVAVDCGGNAKTGTRILPGSFSVADGRCEN